MKRIGSMTIFVAAMLAAVATVEASQKRAKRGGVPDSIRYHESVAMLSSQHGEDVGGVAGGAREIAFHTLGRQFDLKLELNDVFAQGATTIWVDDAGTVEESADNGEFYQGRVADDAGSWVRISFKDGALSGIISTADEIYFLEPAERFFGAGTAGETLAYRLSDTDSASDRATCAADGHGAAGRRIRKAAGKRPRRAAHERVAAALANVTEQVGGAGAASLRRAELGMVADFEYYTRHGAQSATDIADVINAVDGIYQSEVGVKLEILTTVVFTTSSDPFTNQLDAGALLEELRIWRNNNDNNPGQFLYGVDVAHLITGRDLTGTTIGIAYLGALCSSQWGVGLSQDCWGNCTTTFKSKTLVVAHELGHNFSAPHDGSSDCPGNTGIYIMNPSLSDTLQQRFSPCSQGEINSYVGNSSCMDLVEPPPPPGPPVLNPISSGIVLGSSVLFTGSGFSPGSVVIGFVGTNQGTQMIGPFSPTLRTQTQLTWTAPATMPLGFGYGVFAVVNTDHGYTGSEYQSAFLYGSASLNRPTILGVNGTGLHAPDGALPVVYVSTPIYPGTEVTLTGTGFHAQAGVNFYTAAGNLGPLWPLPGSTSTSMRLLIPANTPLGLGAFEVVNSPYVGAVASQTVFVPVGDPPTITDVTQSGSTVTVHGTGFANGAVLNFFAPAAGGGSANFGGPSLVVTVVSTTELRFTRPGGTAPGPAFVQVINPPYIAFTSTGSDPDGGFVLQ